MKFKKGFWNYLNLTFFKLLLEIRLPIELLDLTIKLAISILLTISLFVENSTNWGFNEKSTNSSFSPKNS